LGKRFPVRVFLLSLMLLASALFFVVPNKVAHATASVTLPNPYWWVDNTGAFSQCDQYYYNHGHDHQGTHYGGSGQNDAAVLSILATYQGVWACGPEPGTGTGKYVYFTPDANASQEAEWQCTELVKRYLFLKYGARSLSGVNGSQVVDAYTNSNGYSNGYPNLFSEVLNNGNSHIQAGDVLSYSGADNHTAIVQDTSSVDANGNGHIIVLEQNADASGVHNQTISSWVIKHGVDDGGSTDTVAAWLHPTVSDQAWSNNSPSSTTSDVIYGMSASSTSNVWAAGYEYPTLLPVTYLNGGTGWTKYSPPSAGGTQYLYGIATSSSTNAFTVGTYTSNGYTQTLAYHWTGTTNKWGTSAVTSANPGGSTCTNQLNAVALDSANTPWAAGYYWCNGYYMQPMLQKWNGSQFVNQTLSPLGSTTGGRINGISFSSSYGWAVGQATNTGASYLIYTYNGSSWSSPTVGSISNAVLNSVAAVSDTEAWAVGYQPNGSGSKPLILHTTDGGTTWTEDTSFAGSFPAGTTWLKSVSADSSSDVWIVGYNSNGSNTPFTMRNLGYGWTQVTTPSGGTALYGVTVNSGDAWAGGSSTSGTLYPPFTLMYS
jgi:hypothetical protein